MARSLMYALAGGHGPGEAGGRPTEVQLCLLLNHFFLQHQVKRLAAQSSDGVRFLLRHNPIAPKSPDSFEFYCHFERNSGQ